MTEVLEDGQGAWKDCVITVATSTTVSAAVDLGASYNYLKIYVPTIDNSTIALQVSEKLEGTYALLGIASNVTATTTGAKYTVLELGGYQFIKVVTSGAQSANRTFRVRGI